ncbi:hypothetical protein ACT7DN_30440 [Bacillus paranthracis]
MNSKAKKVDVEYLISSGLPVDEVKADRRAAFKEKLVEGTHVIEFKKTPLLEGKTVNIKFRDAFMNVEGFASNG